MSRAGGSTSTTARELREAFDRSFAQAARVERDQAEDLLAVRVGGEPYALRTRELLGVFKDRPATPVPSAEPGLIGLAGLRGGLVPVYDLGLLLGHPRGERLRWLVLAGGRAAVALAFHGLEGQLRVARQEIAGGEPAHALLGQAVRAGGLLRRIVDVRALVEEIESRDRRHGRSREG